MSRVLLIGVTSTIGEAVARRLVQRGDHLVVTGRDAARLEEIAADLGLRGGAEVIAHPLDLGDARAQSTVLEAVFEAGPVDTALVVVGSLPDQDRCDRDVEVALEQFRNNADAQLELLLRLAGRFEAQGSGLLAVVTSVAGDRGRRSNYLYGASKAAVATLLQGLRGRLARCGVRVLTIKPGFVRTRMTGHLETRGPLWASPERVASGIVRALDSRWRQVVYVPWFWRPILWVIRAIPETLFRRLPL